MKHAAYFIEKSRPIGPASAYFIQEIVNQQAVLCPITGGFIEYVDLDKLDDRFDKFTHEQVYRFKPVPFKCLRYDITGLAYTNTPKSFNDHVPAILPKQQVQDFIRAVNAEESDTNLRWQDESVILSIKGEPCREFQPHLINTTTGPQIVWDLTYMPWLLTSTHDQSASLANFLTEEHTQDNASKANKDHPSA